MTLKITLDIYSGRPNPVAQLKGKAAQDLLERLRPIRRLERGEKGLPSEPTLGYRGLIIEQMGGRTANLPQVFRLAHGDLFGPHLAHRAADADVEDFICGSTGPLRTLELGRNFPSLLAREIRRFREVRLRSSIRHATPRPRRSCRCAPLYEPAWWNDGGQRELHNNCYNYATNYRTDAFNGASRDASFPGKAAGMVFTAYTREALIAAAVADGLIEYKLAHNQCPSEGHLVALVFVNEGFLQDFHFYRKGRNGSWSHKPGLSPVTNVDNSGATISDPRKADRGIYADFGTFMVAKHGHFKIV